MTTSWRLDDAQAVADENPYTFHKPSATAVSALTPGERAELIFLFDSDDPEAPTGERMWVEILSIGDGVFEGRLANEPLYIQGLAPGDTVRFETRHIIDVSVDDPEPSMARKYARYCLVSRDAYDDGGNVGFMYREQPVDDQDSGWCFMSGEESDDYLDDPANVLNLPLGAVLAKDDSFAALLSWPPEVAFERAEDGTFREVSMPQ
tara:strand:+ start:30224 stop:30841 length:618 start_codon:yes stop_codon:yes gene_type:complete